MTSLLSASEEGSVEITKVVNGYTVSVRGKDEKGDYHFREFVAVTREGALEIAERELP